MCFYDYKQDSPVSNDWFAPITVNSKTDSPTLQYIPNKSELEIKSTTTNFRGNCPKEQKLKGMTGEKKAIFLWLSSGYNFKLVSNSICLLQLQFTHVDKLCSRVYAWARATVYHNYVQAYIGSLGGLVSVMLWIACQLSFLSLDESKGLILLHCATFHLLLSLY